MPRTLKLSATGQSNQAKLQTSLNSSRCYSAYGFHEASAHSIGLDFTGQFLDLKSGCYPLGNGHRYYNPQRMRFNQPDEASPFGRGGINAYMYCQGDPVNRIDPTGRIAEWLMNMFDSSFPRARTERTPVVARPISQQTTIRVESSLTRRRSDTVVQMPGEQNSFQRVRPQQRNSQPSVLFKELTAPQIREFVAERARQLLVILNNVFSGMWPNSPIGPVLTLSTALGVATLLGPVTGELVAAFVGSMASVGAAILTTSLGRELWHRPLQTVQAIRHRPSRALEMMARQ